VAETELTAKNFDETISSEEPTLVDFWASWCGPCQMMLPVIDEMAKEAKGYKVAKVNIDENSDLASKFNVMSIPTFLIFREGKVVDQISGAASREMLEEAIKKANR
jgi:thioredoxin 1